MPRKPKKPAPKIVEFNPSPEKQGGKIFVAIIDHAGGTNCYASNTEDGLKDQVYGFVSRWWKDLFGNEMELPINPEEAIETYFDTADESLLLMRNIEVR